MAIVGNVIKGFLELRDVLVTTRNPVSEQRNVLTDILDKAKNTAFGKHYDFEKILVSENTPRAFADRIPFFDYNKMNGEWWQKLHSGHTDVTWPGSPDYFAVSSGTTGTKSKRIPITNEMINCIQDTGIKQIYALTNFSLPAEFFEKDILMLGSSTQLRKLDEYEEGEISGISAKSIPVWFRGYYKPGEEISKIDGWENKVLKIAEEAPNWDVGAISGIPSWVELMLQAVIDYHKLDNIHAIWPNLQVYTSGGVAFGPYKKSFNDLLGKDITVIDTYLASEGFIAFQSRPDTDAMQLVTDGGIYFEFVPFKPKYINEDGSLTIDAPSITLDNVELGQDYVLIISTVAGAWRYIIGDTIEFTNLEKAEIRITGRTKFFLNTVGSQLSVNKMDDAAQHLEDKFSMRIPEYTICAKRINGDFHHIWYLGTENECNEVEIAEELDRFLQGTNKNYRVARSKALKGIKVKTITPNIFYEWNGLNKKKGGQVKMERVMGENKFAEWENFVQRAI
ncbi:GH3 auxin-responsive promoter family protein [Arenibacter algicola]|uniref:GH3 family domain-containing protein n=1 Tax=Arenibacter algicola TaxID=616991 RepID=UPI001C068F10|nr:GH3 auxin-responsive promoter family protein [Arenibacter algicola]MBU2905956.1 GH3 auxin-responsive promoter family protein [Arenibacter algicola]